jgi:serine/threonine protein phosphatase PrpC
MLRIAEHFHASDLGRQRQGNEDSYFVRAPLFVVADGMGGAQAGEVASEMAVESFDRGLPDGSPADALVQVIEEANRRIHERSRAESQRAGMGTTVTAAYVGEREVTIAHVGDSRAYVLRGGTLERLTHDHSLVGELVARGKLTEEQAETHPQRSVITRALGPEPDVQVDVQVYRARAGDVFMVCSDGLTSMVPEARVREILERAASLERAGRELIAAANDAGGRDNITVILFRLEEVDGDDEAEFATSEGPSVEAVEGGDGPRAQATATLPRVREAQPIDEPPPRAAPPPRRRRRRVPAGLIAVVVVIAIVGAALWTASRAVYFLGVDDSGTVTVYRGVPYELPLGVELYEPEYVSGVRLAQVPEARRSTFTDHQWRSEQDAKDLVTELERGRLQ